MFNWRAPVLDFYDRWVARSAIPMHRERLHAFHARPVEERRAIQAERLADLLRHAAEHVPHYRSVLRECGVVRDGRVDLARFRAVPELDRQVLRTRQDALASDDLAARAWYTNSSGGSTGEPVRVLQDRAYEAIGLAAIDMHYDWAGWRTGAPLVRLWGSDRDMSQQGDGWRNRLSNFVRNRTLQNAFRMSHADIARYVAEIQRVRPVVIEAYAESIYELARYINANGIRVPPVSAVVSSAATLYPFIREEVARAFNCPVFNRYGSREVGSFAGERPGAEGLEVFSYTHWVEVVNAQGEPCGPGEEGDVLVTCLTNYAMPIIRYRIGDRAVVGTAVADPTPSVEVLETVTGRAVDALVRADGSTVPGILFMYFLSVRFSGGWIRRFQVVQRGYDDVLIKLQTSQPPPEGALEEISQTLRHFLGPQCAIEFAFVDGIPALDSGKYSYVTSQVRDAQRRHS
ncbi:phenylacetate--CoA ligase family protein [Methylobacterium dankookense]|uniref:Phenylacetate-coenzyme A ligase n=1 Tax=Methylobacterium dankookense TaxID=560405 RepID=A0A564G5U9_9HYPH|nr:phenylacetate--CoA ligase family protein [Methylobacterium dankookense]GJD56242.1 Phenylacetate-coenzyme A ligase [Methylobacterium dankookense]VUF15923.1 Phenylacetate-coenzyme A ligase [Methylobacterium dankookense]